MDEAAQKIDGPGESGGFLGGLSLLVGVVLLLLAPPVLAQPHIVLFVSDDHGRSFTSVHGNTWIHTPNMERLAREGLTFQRAFTATAMCAPSRSILYTGQYPHSNGAHQNHSEIKADVRTLPRYLSDLGYRVVLAGKKHIGPLEAFPFEFIALEGVEAFLREDQDKPFCLVIATDEPHTPHASGGYTSGEVAVPPYMVDGPETRQRVADYATDVTELDRQLGEVLDQLDAEGLAGQTAVVYTSDHGPPLPYGKWTLYEAGLHVPFVVRWPGEVAPGETTSAMIHFVDVLPTLIDIAGGDAPPALDGRTFLRVLRGERAHHRERIFGAHTNEGISNGGRYPIRSLRTERYKYIVNLEQYRTFTNNITEDPPQAHQASMGNFGLVWAEWVETAMRDYAVARRTLHYQHRPAEEFYDLQADPHELDNLASDPVHQGLIQRMRADLRAWMEQQEDPLLPTLEKTQKRKR